MMTRRTAAATLALSAILLGLSAAPALAAPTFDIQIERDLKEVTHSDERVNYTVEVENTASPNGDVGDSLTCVGTPEDGKQWNGKPAEKLHFSYQWLRNGVEIAGATAKTYLTAAEDEGKVLQCAVKGTVDATNLSESNTFKVTSLPPLVIEPAPTPLPPAGTSRPSVKVIGGFPIVVGKELECELPVGWSDAPTWSYNWLRNGEEIAGETEEKYSVVAGDEHAQLQCQVAATNAGGGALVTSGNYQVLGSEPAGVEVPPSPGGGGNPSVLTPNSTSGPVTVELELPGGAQTFVFKTSGSGWSCDKIPPLGVQHAKAVCTNAATLSPQSSFQPLIVAAGLGADAPDTAVATATVFGGGALAPASKKDPFDFKPAVPFGLTAFESRLVDEGGGDYTQAGGHPFAGVAHFAFTKRRRLISPEFDPESTSFYGPVEHVKQNVTDLPRGVVGSALAVPELCPEIEQVTFPSTCPDGSAVGGIRLKFPFTEVALPIFAIEPEAGTPVQFAFSDPFKSVYSLSARLRPGDNYAVSLVLAPSPVVELLEADATVCDFGARRSAGGIFLGCKEADEPGANPKPLFTNAPRCEPPPVVRTHFNSWEHPDDFVSYEFTTSAQTGCEKIEFEPQISLQPSSGEADSPTGLDVELTMPTEGLEDPNLIAQANLKRVKVTMPEGMSVNATAGQGLATCAMADIGFERRASDGEVVPNADPVACPDASKIGSLEVKTPLIGDTFLGDVYVARQGDNPFGSLLAIYMVIDSPENGILVKLAGLVNPNPVTGQLEVTFNDNPELPFSSVKLHFPQSARAPLLNPPTCGPQEIVVEMSSWNANDPDNPTAAETVRRVSPYSIDSGPNGGPCPDNRLDPKLNAGVTNPVAGQTSPFVLRLSRDDGTQRFSGLSLSPPLGLTAYLAGVPYCPQATIDAISEDPGTGQAQIDSPSCPAASQVGTAIAGAGAGPNPLFVETGKAYLAGPYKGAPLSLAVIAPAVAGPLDLGNVVIQTALHVDPKTAQISAVSDPIPTILHGILLDIRDIRVNINRPNFILNPTDCSEKQISARVKGADGASADLSNRFQVGDCGSLGFKPRVNLRLFGGTERGDYQGVRAVVRPRPGDANIGGTVVRFPRSAFVAQEHIRTVCTRVQFAADACPKGSIYGKAIAYSPLLDYPLRGNVYLRSSDNLLPDAVADLRGPAHQPVRVEVAIRNDSVRGALRNTVDVAPDAPVSYFRLQLFGKKKGLIVNSRDICAGRNLATVAMDAHNGRRSVKRVNVFNKRCAKKARKAKRRARGLSRTGK